MRLLWLADVLRSANLPVVELPGWQTRGGDRISPQGVVIHHTATGPTARDEVVDKMLAVGHSKLAGPLAQLGLRRSGVWVVVAAGRANHNGYGLWGNDSIGVEAYNDGVGEPWSDAQMKSYAAGVAALIRRLGITASRVKGHRETDPTRKIDPTFDMDAFRHAVSTALFPPQPPTDDEEDGMPFILHDATTNMHYLATPGKCTLRPLSGFLAYMSDKDGGSNPFGYRKISVPQALRSHQDGGWRVVKAS